MVFAEHRLDFFGLGAVGEGGEAAQIHEDIADFTAMRSKDRFFAGRDDRVGDRRREEALQLREPIELCELLIDALLELQVRHLQRLGVPRDFILQRLYPQQRPDTGEKLRLVDRFGQEIVRAGVDPFDALLLGVERSDQHHGQQGRAGATVRVGEQQHERLARAAQRLKRDRLASQVGQAEGRGQGTDPAPLGGTPPLRGP